MAHDVFISYSSPDKPTADAVCAALEQQKIRCWINTRDILPGVDWGEAIINAIHESQVMVIVFSSQANQSRHIIKEVERAVTQGIPIIPFRIENIKPSKSLEYHLSTVHWLDALTKPLEEHLKELASKVNVLISKEAKKPGEEALRNMPADRPAEPGVARPGEGADTVYRFCTKCGMPNRTKSKFCTGCGTSLLMRG